jgi:polyisoprenyl-phosphate glycosyltransferase
MTADERETGVSDAAGKQEAGAAVARPLLSVVVPVYNEAAVIAATHGRIVAVLGDDPALDLEIVYVDDGSRDGSAALLAAIAAADPRVGVVTLSRNFGHQAAVTAGLRQAAGDAVAVMDADLQDPPEVVPAMLAKWREGHAVVYGIRRDRKESPAKRVAYDAFYRLLARLADVPIPRDSGDFCLLDRSAVDAINALPEKDRFVRGLRAWSGGRQYGLAYERAARAAGRTKYSIRRLVRLAFDGIAGFSLAPLRLIFWLGLGLVLAALLGLAGLLAAWLLGAAAGTGLVALALGILLLGGVQLLSVGILADYVGRIFVEVKNRPVYRVEGVHASRHRRRRAGEP